MPDNVIPFNGVTSLDIDPDMMLKNAAGTLDSVIIIGYDKEGDEYFASSLADGPEVLWLLERMKKALLEVDSDG